MKADEVRKVGVIGAGIMGSGIIEVIARSGQEVVFVEVSDEKVARGQGAVEKSTGRAVEKGKLDADERGAILGRITGGTDLSEVADADLVIEAATEDLDIKLELFQQLDDLTREEVVLATNTSSLPIAELASKTSRPDKVIGMHFFNPPPVLKLLEVIRGLQTSDETLEFARAYGERIGKTTVLSKDRAGFIVNFLLVPYLNSAVQMFDDGVATKEDIDTAVHLGLAHPMGPLTLLDLIGLDTALYISNVLYDEFKDPLYAAPTLLKRMVAAGYLGRKSGRGFYDYTSGEQK
ncbi:MAG TPA: 3-hydroxybutyryl-CoA dehydrogenase [Actinomycetota bacterium]|nr:3-hydroxybutyryl-CoA dehydrogenase [Actinomycetota bacterium]